MLLFFFLSFFHYNYIFIVQKNFLFSILAKIKPSLEEASKSDALFQDDLIYLMLKY